MQINIITKLYGYLKPNWRISNSDMRALGEIGVRDVKLNFRTSGGNINNNWKPLEDSTIRRRRKHSTKPLIDTGQLLNSVSKAIKSNRLYITTNRRDKNYDNIALVQNFGDSRKRIKAREFMKFSQFAIDEMLSITKEGV